MLTLPRSTPVASRKPRFTKPLPPFAPGLAVMVMFAPVKPVPSVSFSKRPALFGPVVTPLTSLPVNVPLLAVIVTRSPSTSVSVMLLPFAEGVLPSGSTVTIATSFPSPP